MEDPLRNPVPVTVKVNAGDPTVIELGLKLEMLGVALPTVKVRKFEKSPPGLRTVRLAFPALAIRLAGTLAVN